MTRIFVSYARVDIYLVRQLVAILEAGGHEAWFDHRLLPGQDWKEQLRGGIYNCDAFVYALTPESIASEWCRWEFARAIEMGKPIIPVLFQANTVLPDLLSCTQYVDFSQGPTPEATARLMSGLWNLAVRIPSHAASKDSFWPRGFPSRVPDEVISAYRTDTHTKKTEEIVSEEHSICWRGPNPYSAAHVSANSHSSTGPHRTAASPQGAEATPHQEQIIQKSHR